MAFEPLGYGHRWFDRLISGVVKFRTFAVVLVVIVALIIINELS